MKKVDAPVLHGVILTFRKKLYKGEAGKRGCDPFISTAAGF